MHPTGDISKVDRAKRYRRKNRMHEFLSAVIKKR